MTRLTPGISHVCQMPFLIVHEQTSRSIPRHIPEASCGFPNRYTISNSRSRLQMTASLLQAPLFKENQEVKVKVQLKNLLPSEYIELCQIKLVQSILVMPNDVLSRVKIPVKIEKISPRYNLQDSEHTFIQSFLLSASKLKSNSKQACAACIRNHLNQSEASQIETGLVPSTPFQSANSSVTIKYSLKISVLIHNSKTLFRERCKWTAVIPITLGYEDPKRNAVTLSTSVLSISPHGSLQQIDSFQDSRQCSVENMGSFAEEFLNDLIESLRLMESLLQTPSGNRELVTTVEDHLKVFLYYFEGLHSQSKSFSFPSSNNLPQNPIPVNVVLMELHFLQPLLNDQDLFLTFKNYLQTYQKFVYSFLASTGSSENSKIYNELQQLYMEIVNCISLLMNE
jgi:hypothetical protein